ncbi:MAG: DNA mismatch repair protein MutS, partial [Planctomycetota bacterium]
ENDESLTLLAILNKTLTPMGYRKLKEWLRTPVNDIVELNERLNAIEELLNNRDLHTQLRNQLKNMCDLERLTIKISTADITPSEIILIKEALNKIANIQSLLNNCKSGYLLKISLSLASSIQNTTENCVQSIKRLIEQYIDLNQDNNWYIKKDVESELDNLKEFFVHANQWLNNFIEKERQKTGIPALKIGFNDVFGYYIEVTRLKAHELPSYYIRKQTLKNVERYITAELKEFEAKFIRGKEKIEQLEKQIYKNFLAQLKKYCSVLHNLCENIALLDVVSSHCQVALELNWTKPVLTDKNIIQIKNSRHPILEKLLGKKFIPNDIDINPHNFFIIITGPNMAGKSTLIKQVALIVFLAHTGSFVPAQYAEIGLVDAIFSRLTTRDMITTGKSTFLVEMLECAQILKLATHKSFVIMDEIGKGTSTYDGLALAVSIINYLVEKIKCRTLFSTHYHELVVLENQLNGLVNYYMSVYEWNNELVFLYQLKKGAIDRSFGIYVAKMAGIPDTVINNAKVFLSRIERKTLKEFDTLLADFGKVQLPLFPQNFEKIITQLKKINYNNITPMEALVKLKELKDMLDEKI